MQECETKVLAWSVQAICFSRKFSKTKNTRQASLPEGKIVVYRAYFLKLLNYPKPLRDQLAIELPTLMGLRTGEVCTLRVEYFDFEHGDLQVLDSKKNRLSIIPLDSQAGNHSETYIIKRGLKKGDYLFTRSRASGPKGRKPHLSESQIQRIWKKWCEAAGIPVMPPRYGRAYCAVTLLEMPGMSILDVMDMLRHTDPKVTLKYISKIRDYESFKAKFQRGTKSPFVSKCARADACPLSTDDCHCRMFSPQIMVKKNE